MDVEISPLRSTLVMILAGGKGERLWPLTRDRAKPSVPFGGIYRIIDFSLSNCLNSGLHKIYLLTQYRSMSLNRHIAEGWQSRFRGELDEFVQPIPPQQRTVETWYRGTADAVYQNIYALQEHRPERVLILSGDHVYKMNYARMLRHHQEKDAEVTVACIPVPLEEATRFGVVEADAEGRIVGFQEKPSAPRPMPGDRSRAFCSMGIYLFNTRTLIRCVVNDAKSSETTHDFGRDVIPREIGGRRVFAYDFSSEEHPEQGAYWRDIGTVDAYYEANMELLDIEPRFNLYDRSWPIRTWQANSPPAKVVSPAADTPAVVENSILSAGCVVSGATVRHSVLSPDIVVRRGAVVEDAVVFNHVVIGPGARVRRAIIDKNVVVPAGFQIGWDSEADRARLAVSPGGVAVIPRGLRLS